MEGRKRVLTERNGNASARLLLVAEAPGARGAERTGVPFCGDASGRNFERLLKRAGLGRQDVFVSNAVICNPQTPDGSNRRPTSAELESCSRWLRATIALVDPLVVGTLGAVALAALGRIDAHGLVLKRDCARPRRWFNRWLVPLYHPSPRVLASHRRFDQQVSDWQALSRMTGAAIRQHDVAPET
jgi:DNA polymerase